jgi:sn-glycerol 3-phosphate transport system substrate-binding protein
VVAVAALALLGGAAGAQTKTAIYFWHAMDGQRGAAVGKLVQQFNQSQGEFEVKAVFKRQYTVVLADAKAAYRKKENPPHIVQISNFDTQSMLLSDMIVPIYRLMKQQKIAVDWADFIETITDDNSKDGKLYSMPFDISTPILYYNKDIFKKAGLPDAPPVTWPDVEAASRKILATGAGTCGFATGAMGYLLLGAFPWHDQPFATNQNGQTGLDTRLLFNGDFGLMHFGALARWHKEKIFGSADRKLFIDGGCAMRVESSEVIGGWKKSLRFDWGAGPLPHWGPPYPKANAYLIGGTLWVLRGHEPADDKGVAQFLKFLIEPAQQRWWASTTGYVPVTKSVIKSLEDDSFYKENPEHWTAVNELLNAKPTPNSRGVRLGNFDQVFHVFGDLAWRNIITGKQTVKEALDTAVSRGNAILRQYEVSHGAAASGEI